LTWLQKRLVLEDDGLGKLAQTLLAVLGHSIANNLEQDDVGISKTRPSALRMSIEQNLEPKLAWLKK
jgi:hypothetical protein